MIPTDQQGAIMRNVSSDFGPRLQSPRGVAFCVRACLGRSVNERSVFTFWRSIVGSVARVSRGLAAHIYRVWRGWLLTGSRDSES